ncbi:MAG TPA: hypothetical protein VGD17_10630 [Chitinophagaceae bacterium]
MRENQRGNRTYADNASAGIQQGRNKQENAVETNLKQTPEENVGKPVINGSNSEGMIYLDIIPRFAL